MSNEDAQEMQRVQEEKDSITQSLAICSDTLELAKTLQLNVVEDLVSSGDEQEVIVSTLGDLMSAKRVTTGARFVQCSGQMSDGTLQHLSRNHSQASVKEGGTKHGGEQADGFQNRYGVGRQLAKVQDLT